MAFVAFCLLFSIFNFQTPHFKKKEVGQKLRAWPDLRSKLVGQRQKKFGVPEVDLQVWALLINFIFFLRKKFLVWVGGWGGGGRNPPPLVLLRKGLGGAPWGKGRGVLH